MSNTGGTTWTSAANYNLGSQSVQDNTTWGTNRVGLSSSVLPGGSATFSGNLTAPATPGTYTFAWKMVQDGVEWFGGTCSQPITVTAPAPSYPDLTATNVSYTGQTTNSPITLSATISNIGSVSTGVGFTVLYQYALSSSGSGATDLGTTNTAVLANGGNRSVSYTYTPSGVGTYYLRACADKSSAGDVNGVVTESNEGNNCSSSWIPITISCPSGQTWDGSSCVVSASTDCTSSSKTWLTNCSGTAPTTVSGGSATVSNTAGGYTGSATYTCSNGAWSAPSSASCNAVATGGASCPSLNTQYWLTNCFGTVPTASDGQPAVVPNEALGYSGSATWTCNNGSWQGPSNTTCSVVTATCTDTNASNYGGPLPCTYPLTINVTGAPDQTLTPSTPYTETFGVNVSDGGGWSCRVLDSNSNPLTSYSSNITSINSTSPSANGDYLYYIQCRAASKSSVTDTNPFHIYVCPSGQVWDSTSSSCVNPPDLTAGLVTPTSAIVGVNKTFSATLYNIGQKSATHFDYFFQKASGAQGAGSLTDLSSNSYNGTLNGGGQSIVVTKSTSFSPMGTFSMRLCADKKNRNDTGKVVESDETNNCGDWTDICVNATGICAAPAVINAALTGNNTSSGTLSFMCSNALTYSVVRTEGPAGSFPITNQLYMGQVNIPVSIAGNYSITCASASQTSPAVVLSYDPTPTTPVISLIATPATAKSGTMSTLNWIIANPNSVCAITASAVYTTGAGSNAARNADAASLTTLLASPNKTDVNDPYGQRLMNTALRTAAPGVTGKAVGKKSILLQYTTDFLLNCGGTATRKVRVQVTNENEG